MTTTHTNLALVEGEVQVLSEKHNDKTFGSLKNNDLMECFGVLYQFKDGKAYPALASTNNLEGIPQLDRKHFVKPKVDVEELAEKWVFETNGHKWSNNDDTAPDNYASFKAGYNAKEAEFTEQDLIDAMYSAKEYPNKRTPEETFSEFVKNYLNKLRPLSLPKSITLNENNEVISVEW